MKYSVRHSKLVGASFHDYVVKGLLIGLGAILGTVCAAWVCLELFV